MTSHFNGRNGTETLLCDVIVALNIGAFLCQWVFHGEGFGSKYKPFLLGKWQRSLRAAWRAVFACVSFLSNCWLTMFHSEFKSCQ